MRPPAQQDRKAIACRHRAGDYKEELRQLARIATSKAGGRRFWAGTVVAQGTEKDLAEALDSVSGPASGPPRISGPRNRITGTNGDSFECLRDGHMAGRVGERVQGFRAEGLRPAARPDARRRARNDPAVGTPSPARSQSLPGLGPRLIPPHVCGPPEQEEANSLGV
jgi:hypothetical protein